MTQFINNKAVKLFLYGIVYLVVFFLAKVISFDKGQDILNLSVVILPLFFINGVIDLKFKPFIFPILFLAISFYVFDYLNAIILFAALSLVSAVLVSGLKWLYKLFLMLIVFVLMYLILSNRIQLGAINFIIPFLASILMFKTIIVLYEFKYNNTIPDKAASWSYFFSFQQLFFPVVPIVDYKHFLNGRNDGKSFTNYDKAITQFVTGLLLFVIYKVVNQNFSPSIYAINNLSDFMLFALSKSVILFKLVAVFIFSIGFLSMFDINLPSSFGFFPLASSFRDYWNDVNRFWRDFILKLVYYPLFFRLKKSNFPGKGAALIIITFMWSCFFHFYQLYWSSGYSKFKMTDVLYWFLLGVLVFYSGYRFEKSLKETPKSESRVISFLKVSLSVLFVQVIMNFLFFVWTAESISEVLFLLKQGSRFSISALYFLVVYWLIFCVGIIIKKAITKSIDNQNRIISIFKFGFPILFLSLYFLHNSGKTNSLQMVFTADYLTVNQHENNEEGYYTRLMSSNSNSKMGKEGNMRVSPLSKISFTSKTVLRQELMPSQSIEFNGTTISTNKFGLRDKEYALEKSVDVNRVVILGASYEMGTGVNNNEVFESVTEEWLNKFSGKKYELLNFGVPMYSVIQNAYVLEHKVLEFKPDVAILFSHTGEEQRLTNNVTRLIKEGFTFDNDFTNFMIEKAGINKKMSALEIKYRLKPFINELFSNLYKKMTTVCKQNNIKPIWVFLPTTNEVISTNDRINNLRELAKAAGFETFSLKNVYSNYSKESITVSNVDPHPNALGHVLIAGGVYKIINEPLKTAIYE